MPIYWIIFIGVAVVSYLVQAQLQSKFKKYSKMPLTNGMTGRDVALQMLHDNGIYDVQVTSTPGHLTDHYNPANKTVNLSEGVYSSNSVAAAARTSLCALEDAFGTCSGCSVLFLYYDMGIACRNPDGKYIPAVIACRNRLVCHDYFV